MNALTEYREALEDSIIKAKEARDHWLKVGDSHRADYCQGVISGFNNALHLYSLYIDDGKGGK